MLSARRSIPITGVLFMVAALGRAGEVWTSSGPQAGIRAVAVDPSGNGKCSCSLGVTEVRKDDEKLDSVLTRADQALYAAKRAGRNQWSFAA